MNNTEKNWLAIFGIAFFIFIIICGATRQPTPETAEDRLNKQEETFNKNSDLYLNNITTY
jgi:hypothetical protein